MVPLQRKEYIEKSKEIVRNNFADNRLLVCYLRKKRPSYQKIGCETGPRTKAIRSLLNLAGAGVPPLPALRIINDMLPDDERFLLDGKAAKLAVSMFLAERKNWLARRSPIIGVIVAIKTGSARTEAHVGWSLCNPTDKFNRHMGIRKAIEHSQPVRVVQQLLARQEVVSEQQQDGETVIPHTLVKSIEEMMERAARIYSK